MNTTRAPGRPRIHPPKLTLPMSVLCTHPLVLSNLTAEQQRLLDPASAPAPVMARYDEPPHLTPAQRRTLSMQRMAVRQHKERVAAVRREVKRIAHALFNRGLLTNAPPVVSVPRPIPRSLPPAPRVPNPRTLAEHNARLHALALADALNTLTLNRERDARVATYAARRAARDTRRSA